MVLLAGVLSVIAGCHGSGSSTDSNDGGTRTNSNSTVTLESIEVAAVSAQAAVGTSAQLTATAVYSDGTHGDVTAQASWSSSNPAIVATTGTAGTVSSLSTGTATISAAFQGLSGSMQFAATPATLVSLAVTPSMPTIAAGLAVQMTATGVFSDNTTQNLTSQVTWNATESAVATVSNAAGSVGLLSTVSVGYSAISANRGSVSASTGLTVTSATLTSIQISPAAVVLAPGSTQVLTATGRFSDGSKQDISRSVTWSSSNPTVASVSTTANAKTLATGMAAGTATLTAAMGSVSGSANVLVSAVTLMSIQVTPGTSSLALGTTQQLIAIGTYSDNSTQNLTSAVTWRSSMPGVSSVSNATGSNGWVSTSAPGSTTISAILGGVTSPGVVVTVTAATLVSIQVTPTTVNLALGTQQQLTAMGVYSDNSTQDLTASVTWSTSNPTVGAAMNGGASPGLLESFAVGTATITATVSGGTISSSSNLAVSSAVLVSLAVTPAATTLAAGTTQQYVAIGTYSDNSTQNLTSAVNWNSDTTTAATISNTPASNGLASAVGAGLANISASLGAITSPSTPLTVTAATLVSIQVTAPAPSLALGTTENLTASGTFSDHSTQNLSAQVSWLSSNTTAATISSTGRVGTVTVGGTQISASLNGTTSAPVALNVTNATLTTITVTAGALTLLPGQTEPFIATGTYSDNSTQNLTSSVSWSSNTPAVGTISNAAGSNGTVSAAATGTTKVTASFQGTTSPAVTLTVANFLVLARTPTIATPWTIAIDSSDNVYVADPVTNRVCEITAQGTCTVLGAAAGFKNPEGVAVDGSGNVYVADTGNERICEISALGTCIVLGASHSFSKPVGIAVDSSGNVYVTDEFTNQVCEITVAALEVCTVLGASAGFSQPSGVAVDSHGNVYVADYGNDRVCEISATGTCTVLGGSAGLTYLFGIAVDRSDNVYVTDYSNNRVCEINSLGGCTLVGAAAGLKLPTDVAIDGNGNVFIADYGSDLIVEVRAP
jgi:trimeric autotransporter adhesin